ncbi:RidA family protein [Sphingomonas yunnanensis]|uniref:RidA family protein n=1 Tax=Sphingomonas yunnanensis TaxID=310400 RepID=UPI001CA73FDE|nr:RidA family protein [Sphingomonas yunnanensis]MBY9063579.1 RidA family protein [Sphingomonas yunnanensis]
MPIERLNPPALYDSLQFGFSHATMQHGGRTLHLAGQVGWDKELNVAAGDLAAQTRQALANLRLVLEAAGASAADIVRLRTYVVDHEPAKLGIVLQEVGAFYGEAMPAPNTFIGVQALALPDFLVEIEAIAALPD